MSDLNDILKTSKIVVVLGPGGVGKTSCSIALALAAAMGGKRVGLLSIDPAKRLADALGLVFDAAVHRVHIPENSENSGSLHAAMIDQKAVFDEMVHRYASDEDAAEKILKHPLYIASSNKMAGPLEYMSLAKLGDMCRDTSYDLIVLDTPPDTHALDFLARPNLLGGFMENKVMNWLVVPFVTANKWGVGKLFSWGEKLMGNVARVTGLKALQVLSEFLVLLQNVIEGFHRSGEEVKNQLKRSDTSFVLVSRPAPNALRSVLNIDKQLDELGYSTNHVIINRCLPTLVDKGLKEIVGESERLDSIFSSLVARVEGEGLAIQKFRKKWPQSHKVSQVSEQDFPLHSTEAMVQFANVLVER